MSSPFRDIDIDSLSVDQKRDLIRICKDDFYIFLDANTLIIRDKLGRPVRLTKESLTVPQEKFVEEFLKQWIIERRPVRIIVLKARQEGLSTITEALFYWISIHRRNYKAFIVSHEKKSSDHLYSMFKTYYDNSKSLFKPATTYNTKRDLTFNNDSGTGLGTVIDTATAGSRETGRSQVAQLLHLSEVAFWADGSKIAAGMMEIVPMEPETAVIFESTANGIGNYFHKQWNAAVMGKSAFVPMFFPWFMHSSYRLEHHELDYDMLDSTERKLYNELGVDFNQLAWRRMKISEKGGDINIFMQEYPSTPEEAFLNTGDYVFMQSAVMSMFTHALNNSPVYYKINLIAPDDVKHSDRSIIVGYRVEGEVSERKTALKVWEEPVPERKYVIGADIAEGVANGDYSVATIIDIDQNKTVARWRGKVPPEDFGDVLVKLGMWYNNALVGPEVNNHGLTTVQRMRDRGYAMVYRRETGYEEITEMPTSKFGWKTTKQTKALSTNRLAMMIRERRLIDYDTDFLNEASAYMEDDRGRRNAPPGGHDDTIMATAIAVMLYDTSPRKDFQEVYGGVYDPYENSSIIDLTDDNGYAM